MKGSVMFPEGRVFHLTCHYREMTGICVSNANRLWGHLRYFCSYILLEKNNICSKKENIGTFFKYFHQLCNLENIFKAIFNTIFETRKKKLQTLSWPYIKSMSQLFQPELDVCLPN